MEFKQTAKACQSNAFILQLVAASAATPIAYHHCQSACYDHEQRIRPDIQSAHARRMKVDVRHDCAPPTCGRALVITSELLPVTFAQNPLHYEVSHVSQGMRAKRATLTSHRDVPSVETDGWLTCL